MKKQTLAEQVAESIRESILDGDLAPRESLPTEPELAEAFGVSRAVIRDATRMLAAQGLVEAQHGRGVFVTESQVDAFADALLVALRRAGATVWDVEMFEQSIYPEVVALAAVAVTDEELTKIKEAADTYLAIHRAVWQPAATGEANPALVEREKGRQAFIQFIALIFAATHNAVLQLLAIPLLELHSTRNWDAGETETITFEEAIQIERAFLDQMIAAVASRDADYARESVRQLMKLPKEAEMAMRETAVGKTPVIPLSLNRWVKEMKKE